MTFFSSKLYRFLEVLKPFLSKEDDEIQLFKGYALRPADKKSDWYCGNKGSLTASAIEKHVEIELDTVIGLVESKYTNQYYLDIDLKREKVKNKSNLDIDILLKIEFTPLFTEITKQTFQKYFEQIQWTEAMKHFSKQYNLYPEDKEAFVEIIETRY